MTKRQARQIENETSYSYKCNTGMTWNFLFYRILLSVSTFHFKDYKFIQVNMALTIMIYLKAPLSLPHSLDTTAPWVNPSLKPCCKWASFPDSTPSRYPAYNKHFTFHFCCLCSYYWGYNLLIKILDGRALMAVLRDWDAKILFWNSIGKQWKSTSYKCFQQKYLSL